jgi:hypothetical protein
MRTMPFRSPLFAVSLFASVAFAFGSTACVGSPEPVVGEEGLFDASPPVAPATDGGTTVTMAPSCAPDGGATWSDLYRDCFGPDHASCGQPACHGSASDPGSMSSGFVCGATQATCFNGITAMGSIVPAGGTPGSTSEAMTTSLYENIRKAPPNVGGDMPKMSTFAFTQADLDRISTWIADGAQND